MSTKLPLNYNSFTMINSESFCLHMTEHEASDTHFQEARTFLDVSSNETSSVVPVLHIRGVPVQSPSFKEGNEGLREVFASLNYRKVQERRHVCAQNVIGIGRLKLSMPQCSQMF